MSYLLAFCLVRNVRRILITRFLNQTAAGLEAAMTPLAEAARKAADAMSAFTAALGDVEAIERAEFDAIVSGDDS